MKIFAPCMQCQIDLGHPSFEPLIGDYYDDGVAYVTCSAGHKTAHVLQSPKFEILLEAGANALLEGYTFEACAFFSAALERFYEFALRVVCDARRIPLSLYTQMFAGMAKQSERQMGAFMLLSVFEFGEAYQPNKQFLNKIIGFRNSVVHQGMIPTLDEAHKFASRVYEVICPLYRKLHAKHTSHVMAVTMQGIPERRKRANIPPGMQVTTGSSMFFNSAKVEAEPTFAKALAAFTEARKFLLEAVPQMQALHEQLKRRPAQPE